MRILITGKTGQVGYELERRLQGLGEIIAVDRSQMDLANLAQVRDVIRAVKPNLIINPAAYTAVDKAESRPQLAMLINAEAPAVMAKEAKKIGAAIIHFSTDYVFDGTKTTPYTEGDFTCPINIYGQSKLVGEQAIQSADIPYLILRTSWVYGMHGKNFLLTILRLAKERDELTAVNDQYGAPTWSRSISNATAHIVGQVNHSGKKAEWWQENSAIYHLTSQGNTTWHGFAQEIIAKATQLGLLIKHPPQIHAIATKDYSAPALRPLNSLLNTERLTRAFNITCPTWQDSLFKCLLSSAK